jgi:threonine/homoserine/homoserine lactone efflux protein
MTDPLAFSVAVLALLATPGPTNTLLAAAGAIAGWRASLRLMPAELAGYLLSIGLLVVLVGPSVAARPDVAAGLRMAAAVWLVASAVRLWRDAGSGFAGTPVPVDARRVFITTALNPKSLVFAFVIFPAAPVEAVAVAVAVFSVTVVAVAACWIAAGDALGRRGGRVVTPRAVTRAASVVLAAFAAAIAGSVIG